MPGRALTDITFASLADDHPLALCLFIDSPGVRLREPLTILAAKQVTAGPGRQVLEPERAQLDAFMARQHQGWHERSADLQAAWERCSQLV